MATQIDARDPEAVRRWRETATHHVIDAEPDKPRRKRMSEWTFKESMQALFALLVIGTVVPIVILFVCLLALGLWSSIHR